MSVSLWKLQILPLHDKTIVSGILIHGGTKIHHEEDHKLSSFRKILRSYFLRPVRNKYLDIVYNGMAVKTLCDQNGAFRLILNEAVLDDIEIFYEGETVPLLQNYPVRFTSLHNDTYVISDIDDTILHSYSTHFLRKLRVLLFRSPKKRKRIEATYHAFEAIKELEVHFIYLSRSEYNLYNLITSFIRINKLPEGPILLRQLNGIKDFFRPKNKKMFKYKMLDELIEDHPLKYLIFFGDDSQFDVDIYSHYAEKMPDIVQYIFIHRSRKRVLKKEREWKNKGAKQKLYFYSEYSEIQETIQSLKNELTLRR